VDTEILIKKNLKYDKSGDKLRKLIERKKILLKDVIIFGINSNNLELIFSLINYASKEDLKLLEEKLIEIGNCHYIYLFARDIQDANIEKICDKVLEIGDPRYLYLFALTIPKVNIEQFGYVLANTSDNYYISMFLIRLGNQISKELRDRLISVLIKSENRLLIEKLFFYHNFISLYEYKKAIKMIKKERNKRLVRSIKCKLITKLSEH